MVRYDANGRMHTVALSGGHDSSAMALELVERFPDIPFNFVCTPTGNELPAMFAHWRLLSELLGSPIIPVMAGTLKASIEAEGMIPNHWARWCTRKLKIIPYREWVMEHGLMRHVISYVGLRADEEGRAGGAYEDIPGVESRYPLREWGWASRRCKTSCAARVWWCRIAPTARGASTSGSVNGMSFGSTTTTSTLKGWRSRKRPATPSAHPAAIAGLFRCARWPNASPPAIFQSAASIEWRESVKKSALAEFAPSKPAKGDPNCPIKSEKSPLSASAPSNGR